MSVSLEAQRRAREELVYRWLAEHAGVARGEIAEARPLRFAGGGLRYRSRARFQAGLDGRALGFHRIESHRVVEVRDCPLLAPPLLALYREVRERLLAAPVSDLTGLELLVAASGEEEGRGVVFLNPRDRAPARAGELAATLLDGVSGLVGVLWQGGTAGRSWIRVPVGPADSSAGPAVVARRDGRCFSQVNDGANALLLEEVLSLLAIGPRRVLELFAGSGNLTLPLAAAGHAVRAVESDPAAIDVLRASWPSRGHAGSAGSVEAVADDAVLALAQEARSGARWDAVLLDPPRSGWARMTRDLLRLLPPQIVAVSCRPQVLARDLRPLVEAGYRIERVTPLDFFPQTRHTEVVVGLRHRGGAPHV
jgi:23S rRNA (uracil1939-C5)-methyltransferase